MATISVANTSTNLSGKTLLAAERDNTITGQQTFSRAPSAPFVVQAGSAVVSNLDADKVDGYEAAALAVLAENETVSGAWTFSGASVTVNNSLIAAGGQINFPAAHNPAAGANILDDYEEGSWTPTLTGTGGGTASTYTVQVGRYVKVGKKVTAWGRITITNLGTLTTQAAIGGLPFTADNVTNLNPAVSIPFFANMTTAVHFIAGFVLPNTTTAALFHNAAGGAGTSCIGTVQGDLSNTLDIVFQIIYQASA